MTLTAGHARRSRHAVGNSRLGVPRALGLDPVPVQGRSLHVRNALPFAPASEIAPCDQLPFMLVMLAIFLQLSVSSNLLFVVGIPYDMAGGLPFFKLHPGTYLIAAAVFLVLYREGQPSKTLAKITLGKNGLNWFIVAMLLCTGLSLVSVGVSGAAISIESYISAWALAMVLATFSPHQLRQLRNLFVIMMLVNVMLALVEAVIQKHTIPIYVDGLVLPDLPGEFRPHALFDHPLTAAMATMMAIFVVLTMRLSTIVKVGLLACMLVGLLSWGGRTALGVTAIVLIAMAGTHIVRSTMNRTLSAPVVAGILALAIVTPIAIWFLVTQTSIGERAIARLYLDDSASSRMLQYRILGLLDLKEVIFGVSIDRLPQLAYVLGLQFPFEDIENPWLLAFLHFGAIGFLVFMAGLIPYFNYLWRLSPTIGKVLVISLFLVASTSNSLGRKSNILVLLTAAVYATTVAPRRRLVMATVSNRFSTMQPIEAERHLRRTPIRFGT